MNRLKKSFWNWESKMSKSFKILKAMLSQDMQFFKLKSKSNAGPVVKILLPIVLFLLVIVGVGFYAYLFAEPLHEIGMTYVLITIFIVITSIFCLIQGFYKSQGMLFECKDDDLLFAMPIKKSTIFSLRVVKLILYQIIYNAIFILPAIVVYALFENPGISYYIVCVLMILFVPIIPTILATILAYLVKGVSSKSKAKKVIQGVLSTIILFGIFILFLNLQGIVSSIVSNAGTINSIAGNIYYPITIFSNLIINFNFIDFILLFVINIIPLILVIYLGTINYQKIVTSGKEVHTKAKSESHLLFFKRQNKITSLVKKDFVKYITSPTYVINTMFGLLIILVFTIAMSIAPEQILGLVTQKAETGITLESIYAFLPYFYAIVILFSSLLTCITSSSISIERKSFNICKSLPVSAGEILFSKFLFGMIVMFPIIFVSTLVFVLRFSVPLGLSILLLALAVFAPVLSAILGLVANLLFPKMDSSSDVEIVKQSIATTICIFAGILLTGIASAIVFTNLTNPNLIWMMVGIFCGLLLLNAVLIILLRSKGKQWISNINA